MLCVLIRSASLSTKCLMDTLLMSTQNIGFYGEIRRKKSVVLTEKKQTKKNHLCLVIRDPVVLLNMLVFCLSRILLLVTQGSYMLATIWRNWVVGGGGGGREGGGGKVEIKSR